MFPKTVTVVQVCCLPCICVAIGGRNFCVILSWWNNHVRLLQINCYTMFVQNLAMDMNPRAAKADSGLLSRPELEQMISWETNNLYEYLKELYDHKHDDMVDDR